MGEAGGGGAWVGLGVRGGRIKAPGGQVSLCQEVLQVFQRVLYPRTVMGMAFSSFHSGPFIHSFLTHSFIHLTVVFCKLI